MARRISWNGTTDEALALLHALREHCECRVERGRTVAPCPGHAMLARDQRAVDGLLEWLTDAARFPAPWLAAVEKTLGHARRMRVDRQRSERQEP